MAGLKTLLLAAAALVAGVTGHGAMSYPPSRSYHCGFKIKHHEGKNTECQAGFDAGKGKFKNDEWYKFMAVVTHAEGRKKVSPLPKHVCGFDGESWNGGASPWDLPADWPVNEMSPGRQKIEWDISWGPHRDDTADFRYWITKPSFVFQVGRELTWDDFEDAPFCELSYDGNSGKDISYAGSTFTTMCTVPQRSGRHVIYGEWGRNSATYERFHGCIDAQFSGSPSSNPGPAPGPSKPSCVPYGNTGFDRCDHAENCCTNGKKCYAANAQFSFCLDSCPVGLGWACEATGKGSCDTFESGGQRYASCHGNENCCPSGQQCYRYSPTGALCWHECPGQGWPCAR